MKTTAPQPTHNNFPLSLLRDEEVVPESVLLAAELIKSGLVVSEESLPPIVTELVPAKKVRKPKVYVSYSELATWLECNNRHWLKYMTHLYLDGPNAHTEFGHVLHAVLQDYLKTGVIPDVEQEKVKLRKLFESNKIEADDKDFIDVLKPIFDAVPEFMETTFKGWKYIASEQELYEPIESHPGMFFKGFIDGVIQVPKTSRLPNAKPDEYEYWIIDWKTCTRPWHPEKRRDFKKQLQLMIYKHFYAKKFGIDPKQIRCGFVLLSRTKCKNRVSLVPVSAGAGSMEKALGVIDSCLAFSKKGIHRKTHDACKYCEFHKTEHCTG